VVHKHGSGFQSGSLLLLLSTCTARESRLRAAVRVVNERGYGRLSVSRCTSIDALTEEAYKRRVKLIGLDLSIVRTVPKLVASFADLKRQLPMVPMVPLAGENELTPREWWRVGRCGFSEILLDEEDTSPQAIISRLQRLNGLASASALIPKCQGQVPDRWLQLIRRAIPYATRSNAISGGAMSATRLAEIWMPGATPGQLSWYLKKDGEWSAGWLARWLVCLRAVVLAESRGHWNGVAREMGFSRLWDLHSYIKRLCGRNAREVSSEMLLTELLIRGRKIDSPEPKSTRACSH
jgi:hypothetical protein